jgi:predicted metal-dependent phosphotriesterase family hydrolase
MCILHIAMKDLAKETMQVATMENVNRAAETLMERTADSYKTVVDHTVGMQERNVRFFRGILEDFAGEVRHQAEANRALTQELVDRAERQREVFQSVVEDSFNAYWNVAYAPLSYYKEGLQQVERQVERQAERQAAAVSHITTGLPIAHYDELTVAEVSDKLDELSVDDLKKVRAYEKGHNNRNTLIEQIDRKIKAAS